MSLKGLTKSTLVMSSPKVVGLVLKLVRAKMNAVLIGTTGVGIVNQIYNVNSQLSSFTTLSLNDGAKKLIVTNDNEQGRRNIPNVVTLFTILILLLTGIVYLTGFLFFDKLSNFFLGKEAKQYFIYVFVFFPLITLAAVPQAVLNGMQKFWYLAKAEIIITVLSFATFVPLIYYFEIPGAVVNISCIIVITFVTYFFFLRKLSIGEGLKMIDFRNFKLRRDFLKEMGLISGISSIVGFISIFVELTIRGTLATKLGMDSIGIYSPIIAWGSFFSSLFLPALLQYIFPKYGASETNEEISKVANDAMRFLTFLFVPFILFIIAAVKFLLIVFYSKDFLSGADYLPFHFMGILFFSWMTVLKQIFIPIGLIKDLMPYSIAEQLFYLAVVMLWVDSIGLWSWTLRFSLVPFLFFFVYFFVLARKISLSIEKENLYLMIYGVLAIVLITYVSFISHFSILLAFGLSLALYFFLRESERKFLIEKVRGYIRR